MTAVPFDRWLDVGRPWELLAATEWLSESFESRCDGTVNDDTQLTGEVIIESGATIKSGVTIEGLAYIGEGAIVGPNAYIRGTTAIGAGATVGHAVEIKNSVLMPDATVGHLSYVGDSILGEGVNFGTGTTVANLRHDENPVEMTVNCLGVKPRGFRVDSRSMPA